MTMSEFIYFFSFLFKSFFCVAKFQKSNQFHSTLTKTALNVFTSSCYFFVFRMYGIELLMARKKATAKITGAQKKKNLN